MLVMKVVLRQTFKTIKKVLSLFIIKIIHSLSFSFGTFLLTIILDCLVLVIPGALSNCFITNREIDNALLFANFLKV